MTLEVIVGSAEIEFGAFSPPVVVVVETGATATITETFFVDGSLQSITVVAVTGVVTVNGVAVPEGGITITIPNDTTPPIISVTLSPDVLWPPNHKMIEISASVTISDDVDPSPTFVLTSIESNEPDNGKGDGNTVGDIQGDDLGTPDVSFQLRAERAGGGDGRIYTVTYTATDASGNSASGSATVTVPHSKAK